MTDYLLDTPLLLRLANSSDVQHLSAYNALAVLHRRGARLCIAPQNLIEFRNVATRLATENGLGYTIAETEAKAAAFETMFTLLDDTPAVFPAWKALVSQAGIVGKQVHDARLVAFCQVHGITHVLTFNVRHFARLAVYTPTLTIIDPASAFL